MADGLLQALLILINTLSLGFVVLQLPGTWLIVLVTLWAKCYYPHWLGWTVVISVTILAVSGEVIELISGSIVAKKSGGSKRGAIGAIIGGIVGALVGTICIPIPLVGTLSGTAFGAALGSISGDLWAGREFKRAVKIGQGAAVGKMMGVAAKLGIGILMWLISSIALIW